MRRLFIGLVSSLLLSSSAFAAGGPAPGPGSQERMSLDVSRADVHSVLRLLAERAHLNLVVGEEVSGQVTLHLRNARWQDIFDAVLMTRGLGAERMGDVVWVAPLSTLEQQARQREALAAHKQKAARLVTHIVRVNYAKAEDLAPQVKATLSDRGTVAVDARTNSLIIRDVE